MNALRAYRSQVLGLLCGVLGVLLWVAATALNRDAELMRAQTDAIARLTIDQRACVDVVSAREAEAQVLLEAIHGARDVAMEVAHDRDRWRREAIQLKTTAQGCLETLGQTAGDLTETVAVVVDQRRLITTMNQAGQVCVMALKECIEMTPPLRDERTDP